MNSASPAAALELDKAVLTNLDIMMTHCRLQFAPNLALSLPTRRVLRAYAALLFRRRGSTCHLVAVRDLTRHDWTNDHAPKSPPLHTFEIAQRTPLQLPSSRRSPVGPTSVLITGALHSMSFLLVPPSTAAHSCCEIKWGRYCSPGCADSSDAGDHSSACN